MIVFLSFLSPFFPFFSFFLGLCLSLKQRGKYPYGKGALAHKAFPRPGLGEAHACSHMVIMLCKTCNSKIDNSNCCCFSLGLPFLPPSLCARVASSSLKKVILEKWEVMIIYSGFNGNFCDLLPDNHDQAYLSL